ncbi:uncharacterized protein [Triticum aestivum]|uniref:uncharacterized protein n=1 Tax=Triticum aestivum TaxID=4565 RepID=UPI001D00A6AC|nr:uncharacterized protein LOC123129961 [Triticum aestivum]
MTGRRRPLTATVAARGVPERRRKEVIGAAEGVGELGEAHLVAEAAAGGGRCSAGVCWSTGSAVKGRAAARRRRLLPLPRHEGEDLAVPASSRSSMARCFLWCWKNINKHGKCLAKWEKARKLRLASRGTVNPTLPVRILHFVMTYATEMVTEVGPAEMVTVNASENSSKKVTKNKVWK